jgi:4-diphosphocytidyl-2C-methyl-D-erythritol kinase
VTEAVEYVEIAPAKVNLALHVRGKLPDGRHDLETIFAFCIDGDKLTASLADDLSLTVTGPLRLCWTTVQAISSTVPPLPSPLKHEWARAFA